MDALQPPLNDGTVTEDDVEIEIENDVENNVESDQPTSAPSIDSPYDPAFEIRRHRIFDHRAEAQAATNPLTACLAGANSDYFDIELQMGEMIRRGMAASELSLDTFEAFSGPIDFLLRVGKQIAQITQLELRVRKEGVEATTTNPSKRT